MPRGYFLFGVLPPFPQPGGIFHDHPFAYLSNPIPSTTRKAPHTIPPRVWKTCHGVSPRTLSNQHYSHRRAKQAIPRFHRSLCLLHPSDWLHICLSAKCWATRISGGLVSYGKNSPDKNTLPKAPLPSGQTSAFQLARSLLGT